MPDGVTIKEDWGAQLIGASFCDAQLRTLFIEQEDPLFDKAMDSLLLRTGGVKVAQNAKYDLKVLSRVEVHVPGRIDDTLIMARLVDNLRVRYRLESLVQDFLGLPIDLSNQLTTAKKAWNKLVTKCKLPKALLKDNYSFLPRPLLAEYAQWDAFYVMCLYHYLLPRVEDLNMIAYEEELNMLRPVIAMEDRGIAISRSRAGKMKRKYLKLQNQKVCSLQKRAIEVIPEFNPFSHVQVKTFLTEVLGVEELELVDDKKPSKLTSNKEKLLVLSEIYQYPEIQQIIEVRALRKMQNDYLSKFLNSTTRSPLIHGGYNIGDSKTGRMQASEPNLENIPRGDKGNQAIREVFVPRPGYYFLFFDYSQIELRIFAAMCGDPSYRADFEAGKDIHQSTADRTGLSRQYAKHLNFAILYGGGPKNMSAKFGISYEAALDADSAWKRSFPVAARWVRSFRALAQRQGYVTGLFGRRYGVDRDKSYVAVNYAVQGGAGVLMKRAFVWTYKYLRSAWPLVYQVLWVHDEQALEAPLWYPHDRHVELVEGVTDTMESAISGLDIPIKVEVKYSLDSWGTKEEWSESSLPKMRG